jgi:hypothetical protein
LFYFYFIYLSLFSYFPPLLLLYSIYVFPSVFSDCTLGTPKFLHVVSIHLSLTLGSTLLAVITLTDYHPARTFPYRIYVMVAGFFFSDSWPFKMRPIRCPETSENNYHMTPRNIPQQRRYWALKSLRSAKPLKQGSCSIGLNRYVASAMQQDIGVLAAHVAQPSMCVRGVTGTITSFGYH